MDGKGKNLKLCTRCKKKRAHDKGFDVCDRCAKREAWRAEQKARKAADPVAFKAAVARRVARYKLNRKLDGKPDKTIVAPKKPSKAEKPPKPAIKSESFEISETAAPLKATEKRYLTLEEAARAEMARRELARRKLIHFILRRHPKYKPGWVHAEICEKLDKFRQDVADGLSPRLMIFMPPRHGKSMICSEEYPAFHLGHHPEHQIIASSFSEALCLDFSRKVQDAVDSDDFALLFPECKLKANASSFEVWQTTEGGKYVAAGVGGPLLGRGAHVLIIDDPFKNKEEAEAPGHRNKIKNWYKSTAYTRLMPGGGVLIIQQRWHDDDLSGWLLTEMKAAEDEMKATGEWPVDADRWEVVKYPAIAVTDEKYRRKGEALHPDRYPLSALLKIKRTSQSEWNALYQQDPVPETGEYFTKDMIRYYDGAAPYGVSKITACDLAISKEDHANYSVMLTVGVDEKDDIYVLDARRNRWDSMEIVDELINIQRTWQPGLIGIEKTHVEQAIGPFLEKRIREEALWSMVVEPLVPGKRDKQLRARPIQGRMKQGKVLFPKGAAFLEWLIPELLRFPSGTQDDGVDALAWIGQMMNMVHHTAPEKPKVASWKDRLESLASTAVSTRRNPAMGA
jgi:predicted phage terminase large subunit-like protein